MKHKADMNRRDLLRIGLVTAGGLFATSTVKAQSLCQLKGTPEQPEGPFYPIKDQLDKDTDLIFVNGSTKQAQGNVIIVEGVVTDQNCVPVSGALVEIWQACHTGKYDHPSDPNTAALDPHFQYWGRALTKANGHYQFRTIIPGAYPAGDGWIRPPHIHYKVHKLGYIELITQMYFAGEALNDHDLILNRIHPDERNKVIVPLVTKSDLNHPVATFDITLEKI